MHRPPLRIAMVFATLFPSAVLATVAADVPCDPSSPPPAPCVVSRSVTVTAGSTLDFGSRGLVVTASGDLDAGGGTMAILASSVVLQPGALLASTGGEVDLTTTGDIDVQAASNKAKVDVSGSTGGSITFTAGGHLGIAGQLVAAATAVQGDGGSIDVTGAKVDVAPTGKITAVGGNGGSGGDVSVSASTGSTVLGGTIDVSAGGDGGYVSVDGDVDLTTTATSMINAKAGAGGTADSIDITAYTGAISLGGVVDNSAAGSLDLGGGSGGDVTVDATTTITSRAVMNVSGGGTDGAAGSVVLETDGDILAQSAIDASAPGTQGYGGYVGFLTTAGTIEVDDGVDASGPGLGGTIAISSYDTVRVVSGKLVTDGQAASIELDGCTVSVAAGASLSSQGASGANLVRSSGQMTIAGPLVAGKSNTLVYGDPAKPPVVSFAPVPLPIVMQSSQITPCGGPTTTTPTSTSSTTTTIGTHPSSTTTTSIAPSTTTTLGGPATTTSTRAATSTTSSTTRPGSSTTTSTTQPGSSTTTTARATTTTSTTHSASTSTSTTATSTTIAATTSILTTMSTLATTTTTRPAAACAPDGCDDGDVCTDDVCDPAAGCLHTPRSGLDLASCRLDMIATTLSVAPVEDLGGVAARTRYSAKIGKARRMVDAARGLQGRRETAKLRRASHLLTAFARAVETGITRAKVRQDLGERLLGLAADAQSSFPESAR